MESLFLVFGVTRDRTCKRLGLLMGNTRLGPLEMPIRAVSCWLFDIHLDIPSFSPAKAKTFLIERRKAEWEFLVLEEQLPWFCAVMVCKILEGGASSTVARISPLVTRDMLEMPT